ncbi:membrane protein [Caballeronia udeis]|uniref:Membrane protein n=1 Tax=Caballeronia udeis TaxID=1232866 RepID=A0A158H5I1_9BURK|nr:hypothetical protein [Caballeronia udeis]SAL39407.1 membrane protein [Caballeronia udeis]
MSLIIAGRFQTFPKAEAAAQRLFANGFVEEDVTLFYVAPSGQHALIETGGDHHADAGAKDASKGAGKGVTIGAVLGAIVGAGIFVLTKAPWLAAVLAAGAGAYVGSLMGAMSHARSGKRDPAQWTSAENHGSANALDARHSGVVVAVHVGPELQAQAAAILRDAGGIEVERASGQWRNGRWADFDPVKPPEPVREFAEPRASVGR